MNKKKTKLHFVKTANEVLALGLTTIPMLIENLLQKKGVACLTGSSDGGKSFLGLFIGSILCGNKDKIFGRKINRNTGSVIVVCTEDSAEDICVRLKRFSANYRINKEKLRFIFETDNLTSNLRTVLQSEPADLIILDTFGDLYNGNLNSSIEVRNFLKPYKKLAEEFNCLLLFSHHIGKGKESNAVPTKNDVLGSQAIEAACRSVLMLRKKEDGKRVLVVVKGNNMAEEHKNKGIELTFDIETGFETTGSVIKYSENTPEPAKTKEVIDAVVKLYPKLKSYQKVSAELKKLGHNRIDKNKVGEIWKANRASVTSINKNDGRTEAA